MPVGFMLPTYLQSHQRVLQFFRRTDQGSQKKRDGVPTAQRQRTRVHPRARLIPISHLVFSSNSFETVCSRMLESRDLLCRITAFSRDWNRRCKNVFGDNVKPIEARIFRETTKCRTSETTLRATRENKPGVERSRGETVTKVRESRSCNPTSASRKCLSLENSLTLCRVERNHTL